MNSKPKRLIVLFTTLTAVILITFLSVFLLAKQKKIFINPWFVNETNSTIGVDVSSYQGDIDMHVLKEQNIEFIYMKATEGSSMQDSCFMKNWENAQNAELLSGAYHFFSYDSKGKTQAENFDEVFGKNTNYVVDPEECMADNFSYAIAHGMKGPKGEGYPNSEIIEGIIDYLKK